MSIQKENIYDVCIIGGGINGAGIASELSHKKFNIFLCDKKDFGGATSSNTTKLIHGGLRYLEQYNFKLVRASLKERSLLQNIAAHIVWPIEFIFVNNSKVRNTFLTRFGLMIYDLLAFSFKGRQYNKTKKIYLDNNSRYKTGYIYTDLWVDDSRLVIENIVDADLMGATVSKNTEFVCANYLPQEKLWNIELYNNKSDTRFSISAKYIINTSGPWVNDILRKITINNTFLNPAFDIRLVKGSHLIVKKLYSDNKSYVLQHQDGRIVFVIPYENDFTLIGTTEVEYNYSQLSQHPVISDEEVDYLINCYNSYFEHKLYKEDVKFTYSGVRPLVYQPNTNITDNTRDYKIDVYENLPETVRGSLINIYGGKMTTYRLLAREIEALLSTRENKAVNTAFVRKLPGGNILSDGLETKPGYYQANHQQFIKRLKKDFPWLPESLCVRYTRTYGSRAYQLLDGTLALNDLGQYFGEELYQQEIDYLIKFEFADCADDIIWRRTKLGLYLSPTQITNIQLYIDSV